MRGIFLTVGRARVWCYPQTEHPGRSDYRRFDGWQDTHTGERGIKEVLRKTLFKHQTHQDADLFDRALDYIRE